MWSIPRPGSDTLADTKQAAHFAKALQDPDHLLVPVLTIYEVFKKVLRERGEGAAMQVASLMQAGTVVDVDPSLALEAARHSLPLADSIISCNRREPRSNPLDTGRAFQRSAGCSLLSQTIALPDGYAFETRSRQFRSLCQAGRLRQFLARLLSREVMGFMAIVAMGMALQALVFGVPKELHEFMRWTQIGVFALFTAEYAGGFLQAEKIVGNI